MARLGRLYWRERQRVGHERIDGWREWRAEATPVWLFRAKPADYQEEGGGYDYRDMPGMLGLLLYHIVFLSLPITYWIQVGWHPAVICLVAPVLLLWLVFGSADVKFRRQGATRDQRSGFDFHFILWFELVFWPLVSASTILAGLIALVWWVVSLFI